jgi:hypothetical protein
LLAFFPQVPGDNPRHLQRLHPAFLLLRAPGSLSV